MTRTKTAVAWIARSRPTAARYRAAPRASKPAALAIEAFSLMQRYTEGEREKLEACLKSEIERKLQ